MSWISFFCTVRPLINKYHVRTTSVENITTDNDVINVRRNFVKFFFAFEEFVVQYIIRLLMKTQHAPRLFSLR